MSAPARRAIERTWIGRIGPTVLLYVFIAIAGALVVSTYAVFCHTWDEPEHIAAGLSLLDTGKYPYDMQAPPFARIAMAIGPYLAGARSYGTPGPSGEQEGIDILYRGGQYNKFLTLARVGMLPFLAILIVATWLWTRHIFGTTEAILATFFLVTTPPVIGHAAVAALDVPMAAMTMLAMYLLVRWIETPRISWALVFGAAAGIAAGTKLSAIPFLACVVVAWSLAALFVNRQSIAASRPQINMLSPRIIGHVCSAAGIACLTLICCYGFGLAPLSPNLPIPVPIGIPRFIQSYQEVVNHNLGGHLSYFMGELRRNGWWDFYIVALGVKTPLPTLVLGLSGLCWLLKRGCHQSRWLSATPSLAFAAILLFSSAYSHINIGVRHVMILFPLLAMGAGVGVVACWRRYSHAGARVTLGVLIAWQIVSIARAHPDDLAYFNELAGAHPERILVDSDLDWGQDIRRLENELHARNITDFGLIYRGTADLPHENLPHYRRLWPRDRATGWIAVSLFAKATSENDGYAWLDAYRPVMRVGKSIDLYYIPEKPVAATQDTKGKTSQN